MRTGVLCERVNVISSGFCYYGGIKDTVRVSEFTSSLVVYNWPNWSQEVNVVWLHQNASCWLFVMWNSEVLCDLGHLYPR